MRTSVRQWCRTLLAGYRYWISALPRDSLPSEPTCSEYAKAAISRYGMPRGHKLAICPLLKYYPFLPGGMDPVK